jgi:hypothetical protein
MNAPPSAQSVAEILAEKAGGLRAEIEAKFLGNCAHGGWPKERAQRFLDTVPKFFSSPLDLSQLRG